jgi:hypothetical protein
MLRIAAVPAWRNRRGAEFHFREIKDLTVFAGEFVQPLFRLAAVEAKDA